MKRLAPLALLACLALPSAALAKDATKYRVTVEGTQTTTWKASYQAQQECDQSARGSGKETVKFSSKPLVMDATELGPTLLMNGELKGRAKVTRNGTLDYDPLPHECEGTNGLDDGPADGPAPDCGTRSSAFALSLRYENVYDGDGRSGFSLDGSRRGPLFRNCPVQGYAFPTVLALTTADQPILAKIEPDELLDRSVGKHIIHASGKRHSYDTTGGSITDRTTKVFWKVTLRRVKKG